MPLVPSLGAYIPGTPISNTASNGNLLLSQNEFPNLYSSSGPLPVTNGLSFTENSITFDPSAVTTGNFDCGIFGSGAGN